MLTQKFKLLAATAALLCAGAAFAQDSGPLIDILVKKGIINDQEGEDLRAELSKEANAAITSSVSGGKSTIGLSISGRIQAQFADLGTNVTGAAAQPAATEHFLLRRVYVGFKADLGNNWTANVNYDFANASFDQAFIEWKQSSLFVLDVGFRKAPIGLEEWDTSSGNLKAIERSPATRYFVESNNGRRLGAGSYRTGVFLGGEQDGLFYNIAVTNPERDEFSSLNGNSDPGVQGIGSSANNNLAYWANGGYKGKFTDGAYKVGASVGYLPDQGGLVLGKGNNLTVYSVYGQVTASNYELAGEYFAGNNQNGRTATTSAKPTAYWIQPSYKFNPQFEAVVRYSYIDSDGRGVNISDGTRLAPSGGTMDKMSEWYLGGTYYIKGNDLKLSIGYIHAESKDTVTGGHAEAKSDGVRSQMQINF